MPNEELEKQVEQLEQDVASGKKKDKKTKLKYFLNISIVLIVTFISVYLSIYQNFNEIVNYLKSSDYRWLLVIFALMVASFAIRGLVYYFFARLYTKKYSFIRGVVVDQIGIFYNAVTPGASGGQIMQAYVYKKQGIPISSAVSIMAMWSIVYQVVLILYGVVSFIFKYDFINAIGDIPFNIGGWQFSLPIWPLTIIGFLLNLSVILIVLLMSYWKGFHRFMMGPVITFLAKIKIIKKPEQQRENLRTQVENFKIELKRLLTNIPFLFLVAFCFFASMTIRFSIPYFVGLSLGNESTVASFWDSVFLCNYHQMVTGLIPIPGAAGVSEYFFARLFVNESNPVLGFFYAPSTNPIVSSKSMCMAALLLWRTITFTAPLVFAGFVTAFYKTGGKRVDNEQTKFPSRNTFVDLQRETYLDRKESADAVYETTRLSREAVINRIKSLGKTKKPNEEIKPKTKMKDDYDKFDIFDGDDSI